MGMNAQRGVNPVILFGDLDGAIERPRSSATANGKNALQAGFAGAGEHFGAIAVEFVAFQMSVGINVQEWLPAVTSVWFPPAHPLESQLAPVCLLRRPRH